jgi:hypothetical protein
MKKTVLLSLIVVIATGPVMANPHRPHQHPDEVGARLHITCAMVRNYVAQVGLVQAKAMADAAGMTASEERTAKRCLEKKV